MLEVVKMQSVLTEKENTAIGFEVSEEVLEKMQRTDGDTLISEDALTGVEYVEVRHSKYRLFKRLMDILCSGLGLLVLLIPMAIVALIVYLDDRGDVFFRQYRVGLNGKRFKLFKFRTMKMETPKYMSTMEVDDPDKYITRVGKFLRKTSIDELPQLINVFKGDMSLVGPRPLISDEYEIHEMRTRFGVYNIRPGVTGLAQINGRDLVSAAEKVRWDVKYLEKFGFMTDVKILLGTIPKIFSGAGVAEGHDCREQEKEEAVV